MQDERFMANQTTIHNQSWKQWSNREKFITSRKQQKSQIFTGILQQASRGQKLGIKQVRFLQLRTLLSWHATEKVDLSPSTSLTIHVQKQSRRWSCKVEFSHFIRKPWYLSRYKAIWDWERDLQVQSLLSPEPFSLCKTPILIHMITTCLKMILSIFTFSRNRRRVIFYSFPLLCIGNFCFFVFLFFCFKRWFHLQINGIFYFLIYLFYFVYFTAL